MIEIATNSEVAKAGMSKDRIDLLLDTLSAAERFGQHAAEMGEPVQKGFVTAIAATAVELLHHLAQDAA